jgi:hypothetical protein
MVVVTETGSGDGERERRHGADGEGLGEGSLLLSLSEDVPLAKTIFLPSGEQERPVEQRVEANEQDLPVGPRRRRQALSALGDAR